MLVHMNWNDIQKLSKFIYHIILDRIMFREIQFSLVENNIKRMNRTLKSLLRFCVFLCFV